MGMMTITDSDHNTDPDSDTEPNPGFACLATACVAP